MSDQTDFEPGSSPILDPETVRSCSDIALTVGIVILIAMAAIFGGPLVGLSKPTALCLGAAVVIGLGVVSGCREDR